MKTEQERVEDINSDTGVHIVKKGGRYQRLSRLSRDEWEEEKKKGNCRYKQYIDGKKR